MCRQVVILISCLASLLSSDARAQVRSETAAGIYPSDLGQEIPNELLVDPNSNDTFAVRGEDETLTPAAAQIIGESEVKPTYPTVRITGFFQIDAGWIHQSPMNLFAVGDVQDGADFRRARLAATGNVSERIPYMIEFDFAAAGLPSFMDVWFEVSDVVGSGDLRVGQFRQPIGMDGLTSVKELTLIERALPFSFLPFRQIGAMLYGTAHEEMMTWAVSTYRFPTDAYGGNIGDDGGYGLATRMTALALDYGDSFLLHLGTAYSFADPSNDRVQYQSQPEFFLAETGGSSLFPPDVLTTFPPFVNTGPIDTNYFNIYSAEAAARFGSLYMQSEFVASAVNQLDGDTAYFPGAYAYVGYLLTGEVRPYNRSGGVFGRVVPLCPIDSAGGSGAWEIAARWSFIDLDDAGIEGGRLEDVTLGVNWYLNQYAKVQLNYIHAMLHQVDTGASDADIIGLRGQVDF
ncbi:MAG: porin [Pirellulales bacterium]